MLDRKNTLKVTVLCKDKPLCSAGYTLGGATEEDWYEWIERAKFLALSVGYEATAQVVLISYEGMVRLNWCGPVGPHADTIRAGLMGHLRSYVSEDDVVLDRRAFLSTVRDRIDDDLQHEEF